MADTQIFVLIEHSEGELLKSSLETLGEALDLAESAGEAAPKVVAILLTGDKPVLGGGHTSEEVSATSLLGGGYSHDNLIDELAKYGPSKIIILSHPALTHFNAQLWATALTQSSVLSPPVPEWEQSSVLLSATPNGRELAPRLAVMLGAGLIADSVRVRLEAGKGGQPVISATVPLYGDRVYSQQQIVGAKAVLSLRPGARGLDRPGERGHVSPEIIELQPDLGALTSNTTQHLNFVPADPRTVTLSEADKIVCGGAGVGKERFDLMWQLADAIGAAVGGTRVAVDKGWLEWDRQIGQTGQVVAPRLFVSCGTSGASQHVTGMKDSRTIIVINSDRNAPMFSLADLGVVGNVHEIVPNLIEKLRKLQEARAEAHKEEATV